MQRLHPNDLTGYLLEKNSSDWFYLNLPVYFEEDTNIKVGKFEKTIHSGEYIFPDREGKVKVERIKKKWVVIFLMLSIFKSQCLMQIV